MNPRQIIFLLTIVMCLGFPSPDGAEDGRGKEGRILEQFDFQLTWIGIRVGSGVLELRRNGATRKFSSLARSTEWVSRLYPVNNYAFTDIEDDGLPRHYENIQREGRYRSHKEAFFDDGRIRYLDHISGKTFESETEVRYHDVLSAFLASRRLELLPGKSVHLDIFDDGKAQRVEIRVLGRETIETALGTMNTVVIEPVLASDGLFRHRGPMRIWLSEDERRLPVRLEARVLLGAVRASLVGGIF